MPTWCQFSAKLWAAMIFLVAHTGVGRKTKVLSFNPTRIHTKVCLVGCPGAKQIDGAAYVITNTSWWLFTWLKNTLVKRRLLQIDSAMRCVHSVHVILAVHVSYGLDQFVRLKSMTPFEKTGRTGCISTSIKVCYECTRELNDTADLPQPQLFSFRVDCRGAKGYFQNLTLFDSNSVCAHLTYRKYGNSSARPTSQWLPLISDRIVTMEKGDVLDFQCVLRSLEIYTGLERNLPENALEQRDFAGLPFAFTPKFSMILDGGAQILVYTPLMVELFCRLGHCKPCTRSLSEAYEWKMKVSKSKGLTYWVSYGSPVLQPQILPEVEFSSELRGEVYRLDKDLVHVTVMEATSYNSWKKPQAMAIVEITLELLLAGHFWDGLWISLQ